MKLEQQSKKKYDEEKGKVNNDINGKDYERWKELYKNESEETLKLSQKLSEFQNKIRNI